MTDWRIPAELRAAYQGCRGVAAAHGRSYYLATSLLPAARRPHVWALYAFARTADELVDNPVEDPQVALPLWRDHALAALAGDAPPALRADAPADELVLAATWHTRRVLDLPLTHFERFLRSMVMDLTVDCYPTWEDLRGYMSGSAAVIGEMMAPLLGARDPSALPRAATLGEAFQHTNFVRDIAEDRRRGRTYLPLDSLATHGVSVAELDRCTERGRVSPAVRRLVAAEVDRAYALYETARPGLRQVDLGARTCLRVAFELYRGILDEIVAARYDVFGGRVVVPRARRALVVATALSPSSWGRELGAPQRTHDAVEASTSAKPKPTSSTGA